MKRLARRVASVVWPAFLSATALEIVVFAFVEPQSLRWLNGSDLPLSDTATYSLAFFLFWAVSAAGGFMTLILHGSAEGAHALPVSER